MRYLLDTVAVSEAVKSRKDSGYMGWLDSTDDTDMFLSCLTIGEIQKGIMRASSDPLKAKLHSYMEGLQEAFAGRIFDVTIEDCVTWGEIFAHARQSCKTPPAIDCLIAAQCLRRQLTLVTRNVKDFEQFASLQILCPWTRQ